MFPQLKGLGGSGAATDDNVEFRAVLQRYYDGEDDPLTLATLTAGQ